MLLNNNNMFSKGVKKTVAGITLALSLYAMPAEAENIKKMEYDMSYNPDEKIVEEYDKDIESILEGEKKVKESSDTESEKVEDVLEDVPGGKSLEEIYKTLKKIEDGVDRYTRFESDNGEISVSPGLESTDLEYTKKFDGEEMVFDCIYTIDYEGENSFMADFEYMF